jgi:hypothetical protein
MDRTHEPRTQAERLLALYFAGRGWLRGLEWQYEPQLDGRRRRPDFRLRLGGWRLMLEVKEFGRAESARDGPRRGRHARIAAKIHSAHRQLREYRRDHLCAAVLRSGEDDDADVSDPAVTMGALVGDPSFPERLGEAGIVPCRRRQDEPPVAAVLTLADVLGEVAVTVVEHPFALPAFPSHLFQGQWDVHWAMREGVFARVYQGASWNAVQAPQPAQSAA